MRALTLWQPWASLIAVGAKTIETRGWSTSYRGPLLIHAAKFRCAQPWRLAVPIAAVPAVDALDRPLPLGAVVAAADLVDCVPILAPLDRLPRSWMPHVAETINGELRVWQGSNDHAPCPSMTWRTTEIEDQRPFGDFTEGRYAWLLENVLPLAEPVPAKGQQGLWTPDGTLVAECEERAARARGDA
jgi:activating signal cointegrator 1